MTFKSSPHSNAIITLIALATLACALFGLTASLFIAGAVVSGALDQPAALALRSAVKVVGFAAMAAIAVAALWTFRQASPAPLSTPMELVRPAHIALLLPILAVAAALLLPRLDSYPYPEPDELHHLIVARNLAVHGQYASGHPDHRFVHYDPYDSVGPPVILPVAASLKLNGVSPAAGRMVIAASFLTLLVLMVLLFAPAVGPPAALLGGVLILCTWGSIYLARTVYGEVPALMFFIAGLLVWRKSLRHAPWALALFAGMLLGLATLSKAILLLTAFPFAAGVLYDRLTTRQLKLPHLLMPLIGLGIVHVVWMLVPILDRDPATPGSTVGLYQHYLMFGFGGLPAAFRWIASNQLLTLAAALVALLLWAPRILAQRDPAVLVAMLTAPLYLFWWCFFTDAHIPRYLWFTLALMAFPLADLLARLARHAMARPFRSSRLLAAAAVVVLCAPYAPLMRYEIDRIFGPTEVGVDERRLMERLEALPSGASLATTWWPLERWTNFLLDRPMPIVDDVLTGLEDFDVVVSRGYSDADLLNPHLSPRKIGAYVIYRKEP